MKRTFWLIVGFGALLFGLAGAVLPLLPTTPFMLVAAFAFSRSSQRFHTWLVEHPYFGPPIRNWRQEGAIGRKAKVAALAAMLVAFVVSILLDVGPYLLLLQAVVLIIVALFIVTRPVPALPRTSDQSNSTDPANPSP